MADTLVQVQQDQIDALKAKAAKADQLEEQMRNIQRGIDAPFLSADGVPNIWVPSDKFEQRRKTLENRVEFLRGVMTRDVKRIERAYPGYMEKANFNETTNAQGAYVVPEEWFNEIFSAVDEYGFAPRLFRQTTISKKTLHMHGRGTIAASFVAEGAAVTAHDASDFYSRTDVTAKLLKVAVKMTEEWGEDVDPYVINDITEEMSRALAQELDRVAFVGNTGSGDAFTGILNAVTSNVVYMGGANNSGKTAFSNISWTDLAPLISAVPSYRGNRMFIASDTVFQNLRTETAGASDKTPIWNRTAPMGMAGARGLEGLEGNTYWTPLDFPMIVVPDAVWNSSAANKAAVVFGDYSKYAVIGTRKQVTSKFFDQYYDGALNGQTEVIELSQRVAVAFPKEDAFAVLKTAAS